MSQKNISVNRNAWRLAEKLLDEAEEYGVIVKEVREGPTLIDAGIKARGGFQVGKVITEICLGGYGKVTISAVQYENISLPSIFVLTDHPAVSTLGSQLADWNIKLGKYSAIGSGPARALTRKNKDLYKRIAYQDKSEYAVLILETSAEPPEKVIQQVATECQVSPERLILILVPTTSVAGSTQASGRIVETGLYKLMKLGLDPKLTCSAFGCAPIAPAHPKFAAAMGRINDAILYCGTAYYSVTGYTDDEKLCKLVERAPSSASRNYGRPFVRVFEEANYDFYQISPDLFAPAVVTVNNLQTGKMFKAGRFNVEVFKRSMES